MLKAVIFDMDGVLVDSEAVHYRVIRQMLLERYGYHYPEKEFVANCGTPEAEMWPRQLGRAGIRADPDALTKLHWERYQEVVETEGIPGFPGLMQLLSELKDSGLLLAVASSSSREEIARNLQRHGYESFFDIIASAQDCAQGKPAPDVFLHAACQLRLEPKDCLVVEDSFSGMLAAEQAGMKWVGFCGGSIPADMHYARIVFSDYRAVNAETFQAWFYELEKGTGRS